MSLHRRQVQRDDNESPIVELFRKSGCSVQRLSIAGCPDLLVGVRGVTFLVEVKNPERSGKRRQLRDTQEEWCRKWKGGPVFVVEELSQVGTVIDIATKGRRESE